MLKTFLKIKKECNLTNYNNHYEKDFFKIKI